MTYLVLAVIGAIVVFVAVGFKTTNRETTDYMGNTKRSTSVNWKPGKKSLLALLPLLIILFGCFTTIPAGHTGVLTTFGKVEPTVLNEGVNFKLPYQQVIKIDNRVQKHEFSLEAFSSDIQQTSVIGSVNFSVDKTQSQNLYRNVGVNYYDTVIYPRVLENVKLVFSKYTAEELIEMRPTLSQSALEGVQKDIASYGIQIVSISIENIDFTDAFTDAVEQKQVALQQKLTTQTQQEAELIISKTEAEKRVIEANASAETQQIEADANAYKTKVEAEAQAEANKQLAESITEELIKYRYIEQWDGNVPQVQSGGNLYPIIDINE